MASITNTTNIWPIIAGYIADDEDLPIRVNLTRHEISSITGLAVAHTWKRPPDVEREITKAFKNVTQKDSNTGWVYNGSDTYSSFVDTSLLLGVLIYQLPSDCKDVYVLDIGGGQHQWSRHIATVLNNYPFIRERGVTVHLISVGGEKYEAGHPTSEGCCKFYFFGEFQVENLTEELERRDLAHAKGNCLLVVSRWCSPHLVDAAGTFVQAFNLLRQGGMYLGDRFIHFPEEENPLVWDHKKAQDEININMKRFLVDLQVPVLTQELPLGYYNRFMVQKLGGNCALQRCFGTIVPAEKKPWPSACNVVCKMIRPQQPYDNLIEIADSDRSGFYVMGTKSLYDWLKAVGIMESCTGWMPLTKPVAVKRVSVSIQTD